MTQINLTNALLGQDRTTIIQIVDEGSYLKSDGTILMNVGYEPGVDLAVATKEYVDAVGTLVTTHTTILTGNPHAVTSLEVGLGSVDDTSDADKPVSTDQQTALDLKLTTDATGITGATVLSNIVQISQADYDAIGTPNTTTFYVIVG